MIQNHLKRGLIALVIVLSGLLLGSAAAHGSTGPVSPSGLFIIEVTGAPSGLTFTWLMPPAAADAPGILIADRGGISSLELSGARVRLLADYLDPGFYHLVSVPYFVSEKTLSSIGTVVWNANGVYLVSSDEDIGNSLKALGLEAQPLQPIEASIASAARPTTAPVSLFLTRSYSPIERYYIGQKVQSVSSTEILGSLNSLTGREAINVPSGPDTLVTRYSYSPHCSKAAEYVYGQLDSMGLDVAYDSYFGIPLRAIAFVGTEGFVAGNEGTIFHTVDGGSSWMKQSWRSNNTFWKASFIAADSGWVCGSRGCVLRTRNGGATWDSLANSNPNFLYGVKFVNSMVGFICGDYGTLRKTTDGGNSWVSKPSGTSLRLYDVEFVDVQNGWVVGASGEIRYSSNGGDNWTQQTSNSSATLYDVDFVDVLKGWTVGTSGTILHTDDGGASWQPQSSGVSGILQSVCFVDSLHGWTAGTSGVVLRTSDGGAHWVLQNGGMQSTLYGVSFSDTLRGWCVGVAANITTANGGLTWTSLNDNFPDKWRNVIATKYGSTEPSRIYVVCGHYDSYAAYPMDSAPGADDNATGTSLVLEAARVLKDLAFHYTIRFICFSGEEQGLLGSNYYAGVAASRGDNIGGVLNFDMVGWGTPAAYLIGNTPSEWLVDYCISVRDTFVSELSLVKLINPSMRWSDHTSFWDKGYSALCGIETDYGSNPFYHSIGDTVGNLNLTFAANVTKLAVASLASLAEIDTALVSLPPGPAPPVVLSLGACFPNPFNPRVQIPFTLPATTWPRDYVLAIFDPAGRVVRILEKGQTGSSGIKRTASWDGREESGRLVSSGVYVCRLSCGDESRSQKIVLLH